MSIAVAAVSCINLFQSEEFGQDRFLMDLQLQFFSASEARLAVENPLFYLQLFFHHPFFF